MNEIKFTTSNGRSHCWTAHEESRNSTQEILNLALSPKQFKRMMRKEGTNLYLCLVKEVKPFQEAVELASKGKPKYLETLLKEYEDVFQEVKGLPPSRAQDHQIKLIDEAPPAWRPIYHMASKELDLLKEELTRLLKIGHIRRSTSPYGAPVFFVERKGKF